jgi:hypothetical protein
VNNLIELLIFLIVLGVGAAVLSYIADGHL